MADLIFCECLKLKRKPLFWASSLLSVSIPLAYALLLSDAGTDGEAVEKMMASLLQLSAYLLLMPVTAVLAANLLFEEQDNDTMKNLMAVPVKRSRLALAKLLLLLAFAILFMAAGGLCSLLILLAQGWEPVGFWRLFGVGLGEGVMMWAGALPCILLVTMLNRSYIVSVILTFFYTMVNYLLASTDLFLTQPFGFNLGTLLPGPLSFRWIYQFYDLSSPGEELAALLERISPYFVTTPQAFLVMAVEAVVFLALIMAAYRRQRT